MSTDPSADPTTIPSTTPPTPEDHDEEMEDASGPDSPSVDSGEAPESDEQPAKRKMLRRKPLMAMDMRAFRKELRRSDATYTALASLRGFLVRSYKKGSAAENPDREQLDAIVAKIKFVQKLMAPKEAPKKMRRVAGTGTRVEKQIVYAKTTENDRLGRTGKTFTKVVYEGAEYREVAPRRFNSKRYLAPSERPKRKPSVWITAMERAKQELNAPKFVIVRKTLPAEPTEADQMGHRVYERSVEIMNEIKGANDQQPSTPVESTEATAAAV